MKSSLMLIVALLILLSACGLVESSPRVVGGRVARPHEFPYLVSVHWYYYEYESPVHNCGGSILNERWILTAAHCLRKKKEDGYYIVLAGAHNLSLTEPGEQKSLVTRAIKHPGFDDVHPADDIGLLELETPLTFSTTVKPIKLPAAGAASPKGFVQIMGWGFTTRVAFLGLIPEVPSTVRLPIVPNAECNRIKRNGTKVSESEFCFAKLDGRESPCGAQGDSGGPAVRNSIVEGVISWGLQDCGMPIALSVFRRVSLYIPWINSYIN